METTVSGLGFLKIWGTFLGVPVIRLEGPLCMESTIFGDFFKFFLPIRVGVVDVYVGTFLQATSSPKSPKLYVPIGQVEYPVDTHSFKYRLIWIASLP